MNNFKIRYKLLFIVLLFTAITVHSQEINYVVEGNKLIDQGRTEEGIEYMEKALKLNPQDAYAYYNIGRVYLQRNDLDTAIDFMKKALEINDQIYEAYNNIGAAYYTKGDLDTAETYFQTAMLIDPSIADAYINLANVRHEVGDYEGAILICESMLGYNLHHPAVYYTLGINHYAAGNKLKAREALEEASALYQKQGDERMIPIVKEVLSSIE